jgi:hypothetical protein
MSLKSALESTLVLGFLRQNKFRPRKNPIYVVKKEKYIRIWKEVKKKFMCE